MKALAQTLYREPVVFLGAVQIALTSLAAAGVVIGWIPVVSLAIVTGLQRNLVNPRKKGHR
jgi:hypothetical protein